jgi:3-oxoacyl-[acyl-carrier-protein] synthase-3
MNGVREIAGARPVAIAGIGAYRPRRVVTNEEICEVLDSSPEWIVRRSGISTRSHAQPDETLVEMAAMAGAKALADAGATAADVDHVIIASMSDVPSSPNLPELIAARMGVRAVASRINAACAGFTMALNLATGVIMSGGSHACLVIGVERMSDIVDPTDRGTAFIFGDGAGAALLVPSAKPGMGPVVWGSRSDLGPAITLLPRPETGDPRPKLRMDGGVVFRWAMTDMPDVARRLLERSGLAIGDLDAFVPHQANIRITRALIDALQVPDSVLVANDIVDQGNTSAASIPLAVDRLRTSGQVASGDIAMLLGFGAGLGYAGMVVVLP